jgi:DNA-binding GntR family transcriptional regulator
MSVPRTRSSPSPGANRRPLDEVEKGSISEAAYQNLRSRIFAGELPPGTLITERRLAEGLGASRTPLRTAINRLEGEGLIERSATGGFLVRQVAIDELLEILSIRRLLEGETAALAAERMPAETAARLSETTRAIAADPDIAVEHYWAYDDAFHHELALAGGKPLLARLVDDLRARARMCHLKTMDRRFEAQALEHLAVLDAIARRDAAGARQAMETHGDNVKDRLLNWLARR